MHEASAGGSILEFGAAIGALGFFSHKPDPPPMDNPLSHSEHGFDAFARS